MIPLLAGMGCFLLALAGDALDSRPRRLLKWLCGLAGVALYLWATAALIADPWRVPLPLGVRIAAGTCAAPFLLLLVQSLVIEIGTPRTAAADGSRTLVTTGTYALTRHPGVLWYFFFHLLLGVASGSVLLLLATPLWAGLNAAVAVVQDRIVFPRVFGASYGEYRRAVPFLVPSRASLRRCLATVGFLSVPRNATGSRGGGIDR
jgi:protein-S-isoprenylcysteine O-methyltransferase Ste14